MKAHVPWGDVRAVRVQNLDFVAVIETHGLQINMTNRLDYTVHEKHIPLDDLKALNAPGPDRRVPDPNVLCSFNKPVRHCPVKEVRRWARLGIESATSGLSPCSVQRNLRAAVPL
jgi:hypothetical protein